MNNRINKVTTIVNDLLNRLFPDFDHANFQEKEQIQKFNEIVIILINAFDSQKLKLNDSLSNSEKLIDIDTIVRELIEIKTNLSDGIFSATQLKDTLVNALLTGNDILNSDEDICSMFVESLKIMSTPKDTTAITKLVNEQFSELSNIDFKKNILLTQNLLTCYAFAAEYYLESSKDKNCNEYVQLKLINRAIVDGVKQMVSERQNSTHPISTREIQKKLIEWLSCGSNLLNTDPNLLNEFRGFLNKAIILRHFSMPNLIVESLLRKNLLIDDKNDDDFFKFNKKQVNKIVECLIIATNRLKKIPARFDEANIIHDSLSNLKKELHQPSYYSSYNQFKNSLVTALAGGENKAELDAENSVYFFSEFSDLILQAYEEKVLKTNSIDTSNGMVIKQAMPYLDHRINPTDLEFNKNNSHVQVIKNRKKATKRIFNGENYEIYEKIGEGGFGIVYLTQEVKTRKWVAVKMAKRPIEPLNFEEISMLKNRKDFLFTDAYTDVIGMQLKKGQELWDFNTNNVSLLVALRWARDISKEMRNVHWENEYEIAEDRKKNNNQEYITKPKPVIIHRDIKGGNIMAYPAKFKASFLDFGMAKIAKKDKNNDYKVEDVPWGTRPYLAPEIYNPYKKFKVSEPTTVLYGKPTEIFALGITFAELFNMVLLDTITGDRFLIKSLEHVLKEDDKFDHTNNKPEAMRIVTQLHALILAMTENDPNKREKDSAILARKFNNLYRALGEVWQPYICVISIEDFLKLNTHQKNILIQEVSSVKFDAVVLQETDNTSTQDYYQVRYELMKDKKIFNVAPFALKGENQEAVLHIAKEHYVQELCSFNTRVFVYQHGKIIEKTPEILNVKTIYPSAHSAPTATDGTITNVTTATNTNTLFGSTAQPSPQENCNAEFLALLKKILMSKTWWGKTLAKSVWDPREILHLNKFMLPYDIRYLRNLFKDETFNEQIVDDQISEINDYIKVRKDYFAAKVEQGKKDPRHPQVIAFMAHIGTSSLIKTRASIKRLEEFIKNTESNTLKQDCQSEMKFQHH